MVPHTCTDAVAAAGPPRRVRLEDTTRGSGERSVTVAVHSRCSRRRDRDSAEVAGGPERAQDALCGERIATTTSSVLVGLGRG